uniref:Uncharacterized protein n=1 Tax=Arundo donax TaxID=35708 RepID=A0A0A9EQJ0_ARUDO
MPSRKGSLEAVR